MNTVRQRLTSLFYKLNKKDIVKYMGELNDLQWMTTDNLLTIQRKQLFNMLEYTNTYLPYYQELFKSIDFQSTNFLSEPTTFQNIPLLTKSLIRQNYDHLTTTDSTRLDTLYKIKTGGTTGEPLWFTKDALYRNYNTALDYHLMNWSGWQLGEPQFWLWGHVPDNEASPSQTEKVKGWLARRFNSNAFILTPESMEEFAVTLEQHPGGVLWSYVSTAYRFAQFLQERGHKINLKGVYTAAEPLFQTQQEFIQEVLRCPVFNTYSSIDTGDIASECEQHNGLHILTRNCYVEILQDGKPVPDGNEGEIVITTLTNYGQPLIRYKIEDWGKKSTRQCPCGRGLPLLEVVEGRKIDLFKTRAGKTVYGAFAKDLVPTLGDVKQFQVIQRSLDLVIFKIVKEGLIDESKISKIERITKAALGENVNIKFEFVDNLPQSPTGKHRYLVSEVD